MNKSREIMGGGGVGFSGDCSRRSSAHFLKNSAAFVLFIRCPWGAPNLRRGSRRPTRRTASCCVPTGIRNAAEKGHVCTASPAWINIKSKKENVSVLGAPRGSESRHHGDLLLLPPPLLAPACPESDSSAEPPNTTFV